MLRQLVQAGWLVLCGTIIGWALGALLMGPRVAP